MSLCSLFAFLFILKMLHIVIPCVHGLKHAKTLVWSFKLFLWISSGLLMASSIGLTHDAA